MTCIKADLVSDLIVANWKSMPMQSSMRKVVLCHKFYANLDMWPGSNEWTSDQYSYCP